MRELRGFTPARLASVISVTMVAFMLAAGAAHGAVNDTTLLSRAGGFGGAPGFSGEELAANNNGRWVAFVSDATNLTPGAPAGVKSIYLVDTATGQIQLVSRAPGAAGDSATADSTSPAISPGGRYVTFQSTADNLSDADNDSFSNIYVRDTWMHTTTLISRAAGATGAGANGNSRNPSISFDAKTVAFESDADNLTADANPSYTNVFARDNESQDTVLVSRASPTFANPDGDPADGGVANGGSTNPSVSYDGLRVAFQSDATNLATNDDDAVTDVFVRNMKTRSTFIASCASGASGDSCTDLEGAPANGDSTEPALSWDGGYVAYQSDASNLVPEDDHPGTDVFKRALTASVTTLVSRAYGPDGAPANGASIAPSISGGGQGQFVAFLSVATNLSEDPTSYLKAIVRDTLNGTTAQASRASGATGAPADDNALASAISGKGGFLVFTSDANNLSGEDDDAFPSVFLRQLDPAPPPPPAPLPPAPPGHCHLPPCPVESGGEAHLGHGDTGHTGPGHGAGHAGGHEGHDEAGPSQTLFAPSRQDVDRLYVMVQVHEAATVVVTARVNVPGASRVYRFKSFKRKLPIHAVRRVKLKLAPKAMRLVKRALRKGHKLRARVKTTARDATGNSGIARDSILLRP